MTARIRRALISVSDKTGVVEFARFLAEAGVAILSTGGTAETLRRAGIACVEVSRVTGFPEILGGRVKTLHPKIHGGVLAVRGDPEHESAIAAHGIEPIDLVAVNLYPFEATAAGGAPAAACIEEIDVGGPALIRAAAKNHQAVTVVVDAADYGAVMESMRANGGATAPELRRRLAAEAFARTAAYDAAIAQWFAGQAGEAFPRRIAFAGELKERLRYGENPHQRAALYVADRTKPGIATARQLQGKELSFNNLTDAEAAFALVSELAPPAVAVIKHGNPCGAAQSGSLAEAYAKALACDPVSAFGGVIAVNRPLDRVTAEAVAKLFAEVVIAPSVEDEAAAALAAKRNLRVLATGAMAAPAGLALRSLGGGYLLQELDAAVAGELQVVTRRAPSAAEIEDLRFAFTVCKHVRSNAIVFAKAGATVGIGAGQMSRVDAVRVAAWKAAEAATATGEAASRAAGSVVASDAFFPFADGLIAAAEAGATAAIQPGGSVRDAEVIAAADQRGLAMVFTGVRHFRH